MQSRNLGVDTTFIARNDVDYATISRNHALNASYAEGISGTIHSAAFFVPPLSHIYRGGLYTCFRFAAALFREKQVRPLIVVCSDSPPDLDALEKQFDEAFPGVPFSFYHFNAVRDSPVVIPAADIAVATLWTTAYTVARYTAKGKFYLIQDYEPLFEASGAGYGLIEASYRFGFFPICNSPGVAAAITPYGDGPILTFEPAVDQTTFLPTSFPRIEAPIRIVFYGRPHNPRNLFGLGMHALLEVKSILKDAVEILSVGANFNPEDHGAGGKIINLGLLPSIDSVAALYRSSDIGLVFMQSKHPSYQPLEYMASGCATVTNVNESNSWLLRHRVNCLLTQITLTDVVDTIIELARDGDLRKSIQAGGLATVRSMDWSSVEARVVDFMLHPGRSATIANTRRDAS
jgi:glycosyltransferase involved in cell wall biosynthesis